MAKDFKDYVAQTKFDITLDETEVETIYKDQELQYNGVIAIIAEERMKMPKLRAAIRAGWLVLKEDHSDSADYRPSSAEIKMSGATPQQKDTISDSTTSISDEEKVVSTVEARDEFLDAGNRRSHQERQSSARGGGRGPQDRKPTTPTIISDTDGQDGQDIGVRFKTSAETSTDLSKMTNQDFARTVHDLENKPKTSPRSNQRVAEGIAFDNHNVGDRSALGVNSDQVSEETSASNPYDSDARVVSKVGDDVRQVTQPQREEVDVTQALELAEGELDDNLDPSVKEGRYRVAKIIHPNLPEWDFEAHWRHKIQRIKEEFSGDEIVLRALYASESEAIKRRIKEEFGIALSL